MANRRMLQKAVAGGAGERPRAREVAGSPQRDAAYLKRAAPLPRGHRSDVNNDGQRQRLQSSEVTTLN